MGPNEVQVRMLSSVQWLQSSLQGSEVQMLEAGNTYSLPEHLVKSWETDLDSTGNPKVKFERVVPTATKAEPAGEAKLK